MASYPLRLGEELKKLLEKRAAEQGISLNTLIVQTCGNLLEKENNLELHMKTILERLEGIEAKLYRIEKGGRN